MSLVAVTVRGPAGLVGYAGLGFGVRSLAVVLVTSLAVLRVCRGFVTDGGSLGVIALTDLFGSSMHGECIWVVSVGLLVASETCEETSLTAAVARSVVVGGAWTEARLLTSVADQDNLHQC